MLFNLIVGIVVSYLLGAIPFALIVVRLFKGVDIRDYGSGNVGFTNAYRVAGIGPALIVALLDILKGLVPVMFIVPALHGPNFFLDLTLFQIICGVVAVAGHMFTVFAQFKGGKGVLTALGVSVGLMPLEVGIAFGVFLVVFALTRYVSAGSLFAAVALAIVLIVEYLYRSQPPDLALVIFGVVLALGIVVAHRDNLKRLVRGEENKVKRIKL